MWFQRVGFDFSRDIPEYFEVIVCLLYEQVRVRVVVFFVFFFGFVQQETSIYGTIWCVT